MLDSAGCNFRTMQVVSWWIRKLLPQRHEACLDYDATVTVFKQRSYDPAHNYILFAGPVDYQLPTGTTLITAQCPGWGLLRPASACWDFFQWGYVNYSPVCRRKGSQWGIYFNHQEWPSPPIWELAPKIYASVACFILFYPVLFLHYLRWIT